MFHYELIYGEILFLRSGQPMESWIQAPRAVFIPILQACNIMYFAMKYQLPGPETI